MNNQLPTLISKTNYVGILLTRVSRSVRRCVSFSPQKSCDMDVVKDILGKSALEADKFLSIEVNKVIETDLGALLAVDSNPINSRALK